MSEPRDGPEPASRLSLDEVEALFREHWEEVLGLVARYGLDELAAVEVVDAVGLVFTRRHTRPSERRELLLAAVEAKCRDLTAAEEPKERDGDETIH